MLRSIYRENRRQAYRSIGLGPAVLAFTVALTLIAVGFILNISSSINSFFQRSDSVSILALAVGLLGLACIPFITGRSQKEVDWFSIIYAISGAYALNFVLRALYILAKPNALMGPLLYWDTIPLALTYVIAGFSALLIGYYLPIGAKIAKRLPMLSFRWSPAPSLSKVFLLYMIGLISRVIMNVLPVEITWLYYFVALSQLTSYALAIAAIYSFAPGPRRKRFGLFLLFLLPLQVGYAIIWIPGKYPLIESVFIILICLHYLRQRLRLWKIVLVAFLVGTIVFPLIALYRGQSLKEDLAVRIAKTGDEVALIDRGEYGDLILESVIRRSHLLDSMAAVVKYTSQGNFLGGLDYLLIPVYAFWPRAFWAEKPIERGLIFGMEFFGTGGSIYLGISTPGDLYRHLGIPGIVGGMFLLGLFYRLAYEYFIGRHRGSDWVSRALYLFFYIFVFEQIYFSFEADLAGTLGEMLRRLFFLTLVAWVMSTPRSFSRQTIGFK